MRTIPILTAAAAIAMLPAAAGAQGRGHGNGHGYGHGGNPGHGNVYGGANCPPGLARRNPPCIPPGQARHLYNVGQRLPTGLSGLLGYGGLPLDVRNRYDIPQGYRYLYRDNSVYVVDPRTRLVQNIIDVLAR